MRYEGDKGAGGGFSARKQFRCTRRRERVKSLMMVGFCFGVCEFCVWRPFGFDCMDMGYGG